MTAYLSADLQREPIHLLGSQTLGNKHNRHNGLIVYLKLYFKGVNRTPPFRFMRRLVGVGGSCEIIDVNVEWMELEFQRSG